MRKFKCTWKSKSNQEYEGYFTCEDEEELGREIEGLGGQLIKIHDVIILPLKNKEPEVSQPLEKSEIEVPKEQPDLKRKIIAVNVGLYFTQFIGGRYGIYIFVGLVFLNLIAGVVSFIMKRSELSRAFLLSAVVITLMGPVIILSGIVVSGILCFGSMCLPR